MIAWTRAIVRRKILQALDCRKQLVRLVNRLLCDSVDAAFEVLHSDAHADGLRARRAALADCLTLLDDRARQLLACVYENKQSYFQTAEATSISIEGVRKALYRAKKQLRECVSKQVGVAE